jgi:hypothetical protein
MAVTRACSRSALRIAEVQGIKMSSPDYVLLLYVSKTLIQRRQATCKNTQFPCVEFSILHWHTYEL